MGVFESMSQRRLVVAINYAFLLFSLLIGVAGYSSGWTAATRVCFWISVLIVLVTFYPLHIRTGLWQLVHTRVDRMDEREIQQTLESLRRAYVVFSIFTLLVILVSAIFSISGQTLQLVIFWVLLYLAHTLPSSILAWTLTRVPAQTEE
jgi:hypothetical protein